MSFMINAVAPVSSGKAPQEPRRGRFDAASFSALPDLLCNKVSKQKSEGGRCEIHPRVVKISEV